MIPLRKEPEVRKMREACQTASGILGRLSAMVRPGMTTKEIDQAAAEMVREAGCRSAFLGYRGFPGNICISVNEEVVHGIGGPRRLQYGDIVKMDVGVIKDGWVGDTATTVAVGTISDEVAGLLDATEGALHHAIGFARHGRRLGDLCASVEEYVSARGFTVVREFVGHGVGRKLHEEPQIPNYGQKRTGPKLKEGMILAIEPMVNLGRAGVRILNDGWTVVTLDGRPSAHFEHTVLVTRGDAEILTWREKKSSSLKEE